MSHLFTDIVVPCHSSEKHNALEYIKRTVETLYANTSDFRLIVVDDYSDAATREFLYGSECLGRDPRNIYVRTNKQKYFTRASNIGLRLVRTEKAVLLNCDCVMGAGWLDELHGVWDEWATLHFARRLGLVGSVWQPGNEDPRRWAEARRPDYVTGHCWLMDMSVFAELAEKRGTPGWYLNERDPQQIHIASDRIACWDLNEMGCATVVSYRSECGHWGAKSWGNDLGTVFGLKLKDVD